jgi:hypothetical protein
MIFYRHLHLDPRVIWPELSLFVRIESLFLVLVAMYSLYQLVRTVVITSRLRGREASATAGSSVNPALVRATDGRLVRLGSLNLFAFYLFGFLFFVSQMPDAFTTYGDSREIGASIIIRQLGLHFGYAADVFLLFLVLHSLRWVVSSWFYRVRDAAQISHS